VNLDWLFKRVRTPMPKPEPLRFGLALGGGAIRGVAHLGVLAVLEREGIRPDVVAGVSAGAIAGAGIASGVTAAEMFEAVRRATWFQFAVPAWRSKLSMFESASLRALVEKVTTTHDFEELELPFAALACDLLSGTEVTITSGPLREAVLASAAIPGLFEPVRRGDQLLVDGQLLVNVPVQAARDLGADYVLGVDIMPPPSVSPEPPDWREVLLLSWDIVQRGSRRGGAAPDLMVTPAVGSMRPWDFVHIADAYDAGVAAMEESLPRLRTDLGLDEGGKRALAR
jgi:NTE family protein